MSAIGTQHKPSRSDDVRSVFVTVELSRQIEALQYERVTPEVSPV